MPETKRSGARPLDQAYPQWSPEDAADQASDAVADSTDHSSDAVADSTDHASDAVADVGRGTTDAPAAGRFAAGCVAATGAATRGVSAARGITTAGLCRWGRARDRCIVGGCGAGLTGNRRSPCGSGRRRTRSAPGTRSPRG
jgi:hypothetical protein